MKLEAVLLLIKGYSNADIIKATAISRPLLWFYRKKLKEADAFCLSLKKRGIIQVYESVIK